MAWLRQELVDIKRILLDAERSLLLTASNSEALTSSETVLQSGLSPDAAAAASISS